LIGFTKTNFVVFGLKISRNIACIDRDCRLDAASAAAIKAVMRKSLEKATERTVSRAVTYLTMQNPPTKGVRDAGSQ
jgi:hypothetical protein